LFLSCDNLTAQFGGDNYTSAGDPFGSGLGYYKTATFTPPNPAPALAALLVNTNRVIALQLVP
jgi:hypothetical protein